MPQITPEQRAELLAMIKLGQDEQAIDQCVAWMNDDLAATLFEKGGFGMLQLNPKPLDLPRMRWINPADAVPVDAVKIGNSIIQRNARRPAEQE